jgi:hypothetical protein
MRQQNQSDPRHFQGVLLVDGEMLENGLQNAVHRHSKKPRPRHVQLATKIRGNDRRGEGRLKRDEENSGSNSTQIGVSQLSLEIGTRKCGQVREHLAQFQ